MKKIVLPFAMIVAMAGVSAANAQTASKIVTPSTAAEASRVVSDAVSQSGKDSLKAGEKSDEMNKSDEMKKKAMEMKGLGKKGLGQKGKN